MEPILVASGGVLGALLRWKVTAVATKLSLTPYSTVAINTLGSFLLGATVQMLQNGSLTSKAVLFIGTGFCGSFATLSTFSVDVVSALEKGLHGRALLLVAATNTLGISAAIIGFRFGRKARNPVHPYF